MESIYNILEKLNIQYTQIEHKAVYTIEEAKRISDNIDGYGCKNLFLTDKKGKFILVIMEENKRADIKNIEKNLGIKKLTFANEEELKKILNLEKGSCTPFGIINDKEKSTLLLIDNDLKNKKLLFHPNRNTASISVDFNDLIKFIEYQKNDYIICHFS